MTDLKNLLDQAAGPDPVVIDDDLLADLRRGRRSVRRRQLAATAGGATAVALVAAGAWAIAPGSPASMDSQPAGQASGTPRIDRTTVQKTAGAQKTGVAPVELVPSGKPLPGARMWCDLKPLGWTPKVRVPKAEEVAALTFLPPGGGDGSSRQQAWVGIARHTASQPGVGGTLVRTPVALLPFNEAFHLRWANSCHTLR
jgi:hypothetical protein